MSLDTCTVFLCTAAGVLDLDSPLSLPLSLVPGTQSVERSTLEVRGLRREGRGLEWVFPDPLSRIRLYAVPGRWHARGRTELASLQGAATIFLLVAPWLAHQRPSGGSPPTSLVGRRAPSRVHTLVLPLFLFVG